MVNAIHKALDNSGTIYVVAAYSSNFDSYRPIAYCATESEALKMAAAEEASVLRVTAAVCHRSIGEH
jgi:hypothetical protein